MIERLGAWIAGRALMLALAAGLALGAWLAHEWAQARLAEAMLAGAQQARQSERAACDAQWTAQIERSNAAVERARAEQADAAAAAEARAAAEIAALQKSLSNMEARNAALPGANACGLDRKRVRLLRQ